MTRRINSYHHQVVLSARVVVWIINLVVLLCLLRPNKVIIGKEGECGLEEQVLRTGFDQGCRQIFLGYFLVILKCRLSNVKKSKYLDGIAELGIIPAEDNQVGSLYQETHPLCGSLISKV